MDTIISSMIDDTSAAVMQTNAFIRLWLDSCSPGNSDPYEADRLAGLLTMLEPAETSLQKLSKVCAKRKAEIKTSYSSGVLTDCNSEINSVIGALYGAAELMENKDDISGERGIVEVCVKQLQDTLSKLSGIEVRI